MEAALYLNHPYGRPVIGWRHEIEKLNREDALAFYRRFYTPNNAMLVVAGDVTRRRGQGARRGDLRQGRRASPRSSRACARRSRRRMRRARVTLADPRVDAAEPAAHYLVPSFTTAKPRRSRSARRARAHPRPRLEQPALSARWWSTSGIAVSAGAWYQGTALDTTRVRRLRHAASPASRCRSSKTRSTR